jgi:DNA ligase D-like protein (predicted 3'-phosphoesterase)
VLPKKQMDEYEKKRDFEKTPEPSEKSGSKEDIFVVQRHDATNLHYDFRLKIGNTLKSWALPRIPTSKYGEKRLAVNTEDHPLSYADFEGTIPKGNYGAGKVKIWDKGKFNNIRKVSLETSYKQGQIEVNLKGKKLKGNFTLIQTKFNDNPKNWLLIKTKDDKFKDKFENG